MLVLAAVAALAVPAGMSAPASADPGRPTGRGQVMLDPSGQLVQVVPGTHTPGQQKAKKDPPPAAALPTGAGTGCTYRAGESGNSAYFCRAGSQQLVTSDGAYMSTPVQSPWVDAADFHSLAELAVESTDGNQIVEIGWRIYRPVDQVPRLFIFHWVNGVPTCYNSGCGYVQSTSTTITPNMALTSSSTPVQFMIEYFQGNWWLGYNGTWFGYYPGTRWGGTFTKAGLVRIFGEVSSTTARPCTNMGNGNFGTNTAASPVTGVGYFNATTAANLSPFTPDDATLYDSQVTSPTSFRYGGPGAC